MTLKDDIMMENKVVEKEIIDPGATSEREEGEISDLDLEDVSDCSLSSNKSYHKNCNSQSKKSRDTLYFSCVSANDSDSDIIPSSIGCNACRSYNCDGFECSYNSKTPHRNYHEKRRRYKYKCGKSKSRVVISMSCDSISDKEVHRNSRSVQIQHSTASSDSESDSVDRSLLVKLNKAVRVNASTTDQLQTSLRTRLKKMIDHDEGKSSDSEYELMELRKLALESKLRECTKHEKHEDTETLHLLDTEVYIDATSTPNPDTPSEIRKLNEIPIKDDITDTEAQQLRLDALRSAVLKKHELRRQKQNVEKSITKPHNSQESEDVSLQIKTVINDLIDYIITDHNSSDEAKAEISVENNKENEDISSSTPVPDLMTEETGNKPVDEDEDILRAMLLTSIAKKISEENVPEQKIVKSVKPKTVKSRPYQNHENNKPMNVTVKPLVINVGDDSESEDDIKTHQSNVSAHFEASLSQLLREARENAGKQQATSSSTKMPSAVQRLPESRQAEYLQLKNRLEQLKQNQKKVTKLKQKINVLPSQISNANISKKIPSMTAVQKKVLLNKPQRLSKKVSRFTSNEFQFFNKNRINHSGNKILVPTTEQNKPSKKSAALLKQNSMISNFVSQKRFLEGKYKDLAPIVKKTKAARLARDKAGGEVTKLIEELKLARARYNEHHQTYKNCIQQYLLLKANIEADTTPSLEIQKRPHEDIVVSLNKRQKVEENASLKPNNIPNPTNDTVKVQGKSMKKNSMDVAVTELLSTKSQHTVTNGPTKLEFTNDSTVKDKRRSIDTNPLIEICPFDLQGSCRDSECKYRHLGNND